MSSKYRYLDNESLNERCINYDIDCFKSMPKGKALKEICPTFGRIAPYLASDHPVVLRIRARLRFDVAPLNFSLHKRNLTGSPLCSLCNVNETRDHVILQCPRFAAARAACTDYLAANDLPFD